ncbi:MAG: hypothetical protein V3U51_06815, partial [Thermoplasmata archaeon]
TIVIIVLAFALWEFVVRELSSTDDTEYKIEFWSGSESIGKVGMSELKTLPTTSYVDTLGSGATDEGPWLKDVILLIFDEPSLTNSTEITLTSDLTGEERTITWGEISNESNSYILDFTKKGTTKFTSPETQKKDRVRDVTDISVGA